MNKKLLTGIILTSIILLIALISLFWIPWDYNQMNMEEKFSSFSATHWFGTDNLGRDILSRIMVASRVSFAMGFTVMLAGLVCGIFFGSISGYFGGLTDRIIMKIIDTKMAFPGILLALMLVAVCGTSVFVTITALVIMSIPRYTRITRAGFIKYKNSLFVLSARAKGAGHARIIFRHILPNLSSDLWITATLTFALSILSESGLSYLGLGIQPPLPSFGSMLKEGQRFMFQSASGIIIPAVFLIVLVLGLNLIGDGLQEENSK